MKPKTKKSVPIAPFAVMALVAVVMMLAAFASPVALAQSTPPASDEGVVPILDPTNNIRCGTLNADNATYPTITSDFGFKIDANPSGGTYFLINGTQNGDATTMTGGASQDPSNSVTVTPTSFDGEGNSTVFDWTSTLGIDAVIVKAQDSYVYIYSPEAFADGNLQAPGLKAISHVEFCYDYELTASKTANAVWYKTIDWTITKDFDADYVGFAGELFDDHPYKVTVTKNETFGPYIVSGEITVNNFTPFDNVGYSISDLVAPGKIGHVDCDPVADGLQSGGTLNAGESVVCTYVSDDLGAATNGTNVAEVTAISNVVNDAEDAEADYVFGAPILSEGSEPEDINVTDTNGEAWATSSTMTWNYTRDFQCPTSADAYTNGVYTATPYVNTAEIVETGDSDTATVNVKCYAPLVSKTATPTWEQDFQWNIFKNVDKTEFVGFVGDGYEFNYDIDVELASYDELNFAAAGTITVQNPHPTEPMTVGLTDVVNGFDGVITADADCAFDGTDLTVPAASSATCDYTVDMGDDLDGNQDTEYTNTAKATIGGGSFSGTAAFKFGDVDPTLAEGSEPAEVTATDDNATPNDANDDHNSSTISASTENVITYKQEGVCPTDLNLYTNGKFELTLTNKAVIDQTTDFDTETVTITCYDPAEAKVVKTTTEGLEDIGQFPLTFELYDPSNTLVESQDLNAAGNLIFATEIKTAGTWTVKEVLPAGWVSTTDTECTFNVAFPGSAGQTYTCNFNNVEKSRVDLLKLTNGEPTTSQTWSFAIYEGPDGFDGTQVASDSTPPALLDFGFADLSKFETYTICELGVPASYSVFWQIDTDGDGVGDVTVVPYNPNADDETPEDLGNRCVDFGANTNIPLVPGTTLHFVVDNQQPGGAPRTPGYWKNWNRCTGGGQQYTADANGGWQEGFWLLEDVLDPQIGGGILWDDILTDNVLFPIDSCAVAVDLLDKREVGDPTVVGDGKKQASNAFFNLATHLLAAQLNFGAGACTTEEVLDAALDAETLLDKYDFQGKAVKSWPRKGDDITLAYELATYLDQYNNGAFCGNGND